MKRFVPALLLILAFAHPSSAQKKFTEGTISYDVVVNTKSDNAKGADYMDGTTIANYIKGDKSRTEMVNALGTVTTIYDSSKGQIAILKEFGDQKYMITMTPADWRDSKKKFDGIQYTIDDNSSQTILGYVCKKALGTLKDGTSYTVWFTPDLITENKTFQYDTKDLPGLAMQYQILTKGKEVTYTVSKISFSPVAASKFELPKSGFRVMSYGESKGN